VKCIAWNFNGFNFAKSKLENFNCNKKDLKKLRFENGDIIPDVENYFTKY
jgi:hypothetical protein